MPRRTEIKPVLEEIVARVLQSAMPRLQEEIVRQAEEQVQGLLPEPGADSSGALDAALASIQDASTQADILRQLLEGCSRFAARVAIFVVRSGSITGWQGTGFDDDEGVKNAGLSATAGLVARAMNGRSFVTGATRDFDSGFISMVKAPVEDLCAVMPLIVKDKIAALIYADGGSSGPAADTAALTALTRFAGLWLELSALRKGEAAPRAEEPAPQPVVATAATVAASAASNIAAASYSAPASASEEDELHRKAKRFAKLLVEEIKLYNAAKVNAGRENRDLYERLRDDIEKSRATYDKRYADGAVASANYFNQELIRILADNDVNLMGSAFPR